MRPTMLHIPFKPPPYPLSKQILFLAEHLLPSGKQYTSLTIDATIFQSSTPKILLLKRSPFEKQSPNFWEIPGGKVDDTHKTIWDALKRAVNKKTGFCIKETEITKGEEGFEWALDEDDKDDTEMALELNFLVESEELPEEVKLDSERHLKSVWADERDIGGLEMTPEMRDVVERAFACLKLRRRVVWARAISGLELEE